MKLLDYTPEIVFGRFFSAWAPFFVVLALVVSNVFLVLHVSQIRGSRWSFGQQASWSEAVERELRMFHPEISIPHPADFQTKPVR